MLLCDTEAAATLTVEGETPVKSYQSPGSAVGGLKYAPAGGAGYGCSPALRKPIVQYGRSVDEQPQSSRHFRDLSTIVLAV